MLRFSSGRLKSSRLSRCPVLCNHFSKITTSSRGVELTVASNVKQQIKVTAKQLGFSGSLLTKVKVPKAITLAVPWLLDNSLTNRYSTGQRGNLIGELPNENYTFSPGKCDYTVTRADFLPCRKFDKEQLEVMLKSPDGKITSISVAAQSIIKYVLYKNIEVPPPPPVTDISDVYRVQYKDLTASCNNNNKKNSNKKTQYESEISAKLSTQQYDALKRLALDGILLVEGCGSGEKAVMDVADVLGGVMPTLYGIDWHVKSAPTEGPKNNVAYTRLRLALHQDLAYHESMPGIQLLHCQRFDKSVIGGESTFLDSLLVARRMQKKYPKEFTLLTRLPVAFMKDDMDRPVPAQYYYATPHIHLNDRGEVTKMFWSPAFEAPLPLEGREADAYYDARAKFVEVLREAREESLIKFHLQEGQMIVFQQPRVWHGREEFEEKKTSSRILHGAYVNLDVFRNNVVAQSMLHKEELFPLFMFHLLNRSWR